MSPPFIHVAWPSAVPASIDIRTTADTDVGHARGGFTEVWNDNPAFHTRVGSVISYVGVRFQNVQIPKNATITTATMTVYAPDNSRNYNSPADDTDVGIEAADSPGIMNNNDFETRQGNLAATAFNWALSGGLGFYSNNDPLAPITLTAALQAIVNRAGWVSGNAIMVWFRHGGDGTTSNGFRPHQGQTASVTPRLQVDYTA